MKQNYFEDLDTGWDDLISNVYNDKYVFKPEYEIIDGKKYLNKVYDNDIINGKKELYLDDDLYEVSYSTFLKCSNLVGELVIPDSVEVIGMAAFCDCTGFTSLKLSNNLKEIAGWSFNNCTSLSGELIIPKNVNFIGFEVFSRCNFSKIYVPKKHVNKYDKKWNYECDAEIIYY